MADIKAKDIKKVVKIINCDVNENCWRVMVNSATGEIWADEHINCDSYVVYDDDNISCIRKWDNARFRPIGYMDIMHELYNIGIFDI